MPIDPLSAYPRSSVWPTELQMTTARYVPHCRELPWPPSLPLDASSRAISEYAASLLEGSDAIFILAQAAWIPHPVRTPVIQVVYYLPRE